MLAFRRFSARATYFRFFLTRSINSTKSSGSGSVTFRAFAARRTRALIVRTSAAVYFAAFRGWWM
jgi:hypothetical protein